jgi:hypothetical protein
VSDLKTIVERAAEGNLPFLLIGGHAVIAHGYQVRTIDWDFAVERDRRQEWLSLMTALGFAVFRESPAFLQFIPPAGRFNPVDLMRPTRRLFKTAAYRSRSHSGGREAKGRLLAGPDHLKNAMP